MSEDERDKRLRTSALIEVNGQSLVVDCGPDFRQQMLRSKTTNVTAVLITHEHNDHIIGLDDVRPFNFMNWKDMPVYTTSRVAKDLTNRFAYVFAPNPYPGAPKITLNLISKEEPFYVDQTYVIPIEVDHGKLPVLGFRIGDFTYLTDVKSIEEEELQKVMGSRVIVLNALRKQPHHSHLSLDEALALIERIKPEKAYLTHLSHRMGLHQDVSEELPDNVALAYDGLVVTLEDPVH